VISGEDASTLALKGSTEEAQFLSNTSAEDKAEREDDAALD